MGASRITLYLRVRRGRFSSSRFAYAIGAAKGKLLVAAVWPLRGTVDHYIDRVVDLTDPERPTWAGTGGEDNTVARSPGATV